MSGPANQCAFYSWANCLQTLCPNSKSEGKGNGENWLGFNNSQGRPTCVPRQIPGNTTYGIPQN